MGDARESIHHAAAEGFAVAADDYARGRPDYPPVILAWLRDDLGVGPGTTVVDLAAGTGKFTARLVEAGATVTAVEPIDAMRERLAAALPGVPALPGTATSIPIADASADVVACAQAFHWFATPGALAEIRRVLRPGGRLGLVWNARDERVGWTGRLARITEPHEGGAPQFRTGAWRDAFPAEGFGPLHERTFSHSHAGPPGDVIVRRALSTSYIAALPPERKAQVRDEILALIASEPELAGRDEVVVPYRTFAYWTEKA
ncbi:MAG: SAM-dependent methyltransferase [Planctomycetales bacterium 71-10]|nr:MAG: SAM-dependent methyltransferase [Planctomycetales bacterium 71-10]